jgi:hypothetical protein
MSIKQLICFYLILGCANVAYSLKDYEKNYDQQFKKELAQSLQNKNLKVEEGYRRIQQAGGENNVEALMHTIRVLVYITLWPLITIDIFKYLKKRFNNI